MSYTETEIKYHTKEKIRDEYLKNHGDPINSKTTPNITKNENLTHVLGEIKEWETSEIFPITDPEFIPEDRRYTGRSYAKPKTKPSYEDKYKALFQSYNSFCMPPAKKTDY